MSLAPLAAPDPAVSSLAQCKEAECTKLRTSLRTLKPVRLQLQQAAALRDKAAKKVSVLEGELKQLDDLVTLKQNELAEAAAALSSKEPDDVSKFAAALTAQPCSARSIAVGPPSFADAAVLAANFAAASPQSRAASFAARLQVQFAPEPPPVPGKAELESDFEVA